MITDERQESFGFRSFGKVALGDKRRTKRLVESVNSMCRHVRSATASPNLHPVIRMGQMNDHPDPRHQHD